MDSCTTTGPSVSFENLNPVADGELLAERSIGGRELTVGVNAPFNFDPSGRSPGALVSKKCLVR